MLRQSKEMRSFELNIHREPSIGEVFEHVLIGGVHIRDEVTVTGISDVEIDHSSSPERPPKTPPLTKRAARLPRRGGWALMATPSMQTQTEVPDAPPNPPDPRDGPVRTPPIPPPLPTDEPQPKPVQDPPAEEEPKPPLIVADIRAALLHPTQRPVQISR
jgi:hypothetical protein